MTCLSGAKSNRSKRLAGRPAPGFTLMEMVVSVSIIVMVTVVFIANYHATNRRTDLTMAAQALVADLHLAQNNTLGLIKYNGALPAGGWGVHFNIDSTDYVTFADLNAPGESGAMSYDSATEGNVDYGARVSHLPSGVVINSLADTSGSPTIVDVTFLPPDPTTSIFNGSATSSVLSIRLKDTHTGQTKTVQVNFLGLAEVID